MKNQSSFFLPRNIGGLICCLAKTAGGGAEVVAWNGKSWVPANIPAGDVLAAPVASDRRMAELGIWLTPRGRAVVKEAQPRKIWDPEEAEDRALDRMFEKLRNK